MTEPSQSNDPQEAAEKGLTIRHCTICGDDAGVQWLFSLLGRGLIIEDCTIVSDMTMPDGSVVVEPK